MALIVKKYGGSSVATPEKILALAHLLKKLRDEGHRIIVIVSAMGDFTDELVALSRKITASPDQREFDMLLSTGERVSIAMMSMALHSIGCNAISLTGSQSGVFTDAIHNNARVVDIRAFRVHEELEKGKVVIVAGFQGVNPVTKEITTLGRGGSDTTAVALAAAFHAQRCEILTDVAGIFSADPRIVPGAQHRAELDVDVTLEMAYWGAGILHYRCVELAERNGIPLYVGLSAGDRSTSVIKMKPFQKEKVSMEQIEIQSVNVNTQVASLLFPSGSPGEAMTDFQAALDKAKLARPLILHQQSGSAGVEILMTAPSELLESIQKAVIGKKPGIQMNHDLATVALTGRGFVAAGFCFELANWLSSKSISFQTLITTPLSVSFVVNKSQAAETARALHQKYIELDK